MLRYAVTKAASSKKTTVPFGRNDLNNDQGRFARKFHDKMTAKTPKLFFAPRRPCHRKMTVKQLQMTLS